MSVSVLRARTPDRRHGHGFFSMRYALCAIRYLPILPKGKGVPEL